MKPLKPFSVIGLKFLDKNGELSKKTYEYLMTEELSNKFRSTYTNSIGANSYLILNENAYNYRNSRVVVHYWEKAKYEYYPELLYLNNIYEAMPVKIKNRCYDGSTPFDEKEKDMKDMKDIKFTNSTATAISNVANAAKIANDSWNVLSDSISAYASVDSNSISTTPMVRFDSTGITIDNDTELNLNYEKVYDKLEKVKEERNRKESKKMFENVMKNFEFGKCGNAVKMSVYGPAFKDGEGNYIAFNGDEAMDVTGMTFDFECFYKMPVAHDDVQIGDYIYHRSVPVRVVDATERGSFVCVSLFTHEEVTVVPVKNMFGFNFFTKLINFGESLFGTNTIDKSNPFGSMLPLFLMSKGGGNDNLMMAMMMSQGKMDFNSNPLMLMALMGDKNSDMLPVLMMMQMERKPHKCKCGNCHEEKDN